MDTACVDYEDYAFCLRDLSRVNAVTQTHRPTLAWLKRQVKTHGRFSVLDVASGHGDCLRAIRKRYPNAQLTGVDLNPWATKAAISATPAEAQITFQCADAFSYIPGLQVDFIISSQFTHHLSKPEIIRFLIWQKAHARRGWFISDLHRHWLPYYGFPFLARILGWHHFVRTDGQISIARSFVPSEWHEMLTDAGVEGEISWHFPFRLCVSGR